MFQILCLHVFQVRTHTTNFDRSIAFFPTRGPTASQIFGLAWEAIEKLHLYGVKCVAITGDGIAYANSYIVAGVQVY